MADDDQERPRRQRDEGLAAERMALDHGQLQRQFVRRAPDDRDQHAGVRPLRFGGGQIVIALGLAAIDRVVVVAAHIDDVAEFGKALAGQRPRDDRLHGARPAMPARRASRGG